jgi:hypothetical protein
MLFEFSITKLSTLFPDFANVIGNVEGEMLTIWHSYTEVRVQVLGIKCITGTQKLLFPLRRLRTERNLPTLAKSLIVDWLSV